MLRKYTNVGGEVANEHNLIPVRSENEAREKGRKGGIASGEARRRKKTLKATMKAVLSLEVTDTDTWNMLSSMGIDPQDMDNQTAMAVALLRRAIMAGDVAAFKEIRNLIGEDNDAERLKLQKKQLSLQEKKLGGDTDEDISDDGFINALNGSAEEDWNEE